MQNDGHEMNLTEQIEFLRGQLGMRWPYQWRQALWNVTPEKIRWKIGKIGTSGDGRIQKAYLDEIEQYCLELASRRLDPPITLQMLEVRIKAALTGTGTEPGIIGKSIHQIISGAPNADDPNEDA